MVPKILDLDANLLSEGVDLLVKLLFVLQLKSRPPIFHFKIIVNIFNFLSFQILAEYTAQEKGSLEEPDFVAALVMGLRQRLTSIIFLQILHHFRWRSDWVFYNKRIYFFDRHELQRNRLTRFAMFLLWYYFLFWFSRWIEWRTRWAEKIAVAVLILEIILVIIGSVCAIN